VRRWQIDGFGVWVKGRIARLNLKQIIMVPSSTTTFFYSGMNIRFGLQKSIIRSQLQKLQNKVH
jgi:hypothetical protein